MSLDPLAGVGISPHWSKALTMENRLAWLASAPVVPLPVVPEVILPEVREEWAQWRDERHAAVAASPKAHAYTIELLASLDAAVAMNWEVCSSLGMRRVWPFLSREVIEIVASLRPADLIVPMRKRLSRTAFRGRVPDRFLDRSDSGLFGHGRVFEPVSFGRLPEELAGIFTDEVMEGAVAAGLQLAGNLRKLASGSG